MDAGTVSLKAMLLHKGQLQYFQRTHLGEPQKAFDRMLSEDRLEAHAAHMFLTGKYASLLLRGSSLKMVSPPDALIHILKSDQYQHIRYLVDIGSSGLSLMELKGGKLQRYETNSLCAAGTGAFLDQQMQRLGLSYDSVSRIPVLASAPHIASRCSVFAKSDLIHRQQEGYTIEQCWNGLVKGLAMAAFSTLFRGQSVDGPVMLIGGLANNRVFGHYFGQMLGGHPLVMPGNPGFFLAEALIAFAGQNGGHNKAMQQPGQRPGFVYEKPLQAKIARKELHKQYIDSHANEVDLFCLAPGEKLGVYTGLDIGSTSTKMALLDGSGKIRLGLYTRTGGKPVEAFQRLLRGLRDISAEHSVTFEFNGLGTTGSGRKLLGHFAGADLVKNEITSHLKGAVKEFPDVRTIFEIGGQDAKYILVENGWMKDANMNYVCAAGTGSFLEEQAKNLDIGLDDIGHVCRNAMPPISSHRCTVFMEQDANQMLVRGIKKSQVMAAVLYAVCKNYLNRVVQHRPVHGPVLFLGATAKNTALVEAFENVLQKQVHTSRYSHLMGAIGVAEMLRETPPVRSSFRGWELVDATIRLWESHCEDCNNRCRLTHMQFDGEEATASWGYQCGKDPALPVGRPGTHMEGLRQPGRPGQSHVSVGKATATLYYPKALQYYTYHVFWQHFFSLLGIELKVPEGPKEEVAGLTGKYALTDCCFPLKLAVGKTVHGVLNNNTPMFVPHHIQDNPNPRAANSYFCPLSQAFPSVLKSTLKVNRLETGGLMSPVVDFSGEVLRNVKELQKALHPHFRFPVKQLRNAWESALLQYEKEKNRLIEAGQALMVKNRNSGKPAFVLIGRSYNMLDPVLNLGIPRAIARYGYDVIPMDMLPAFRSQLPSGYRDMYWSYGQKIVVVARLLEEHRGLYPIFLTNFNCGPDSFLLSTFEEEMKNRPYLILELDEHGGDGGYITRLEAFFDRVAHHMGSPVRKLPPTKSRTLAKAEALSAYKVYIPPMHPIASRLVSAAFRGHGIDSTALLKEDAETYSLGSNFVRGSECMPAASTIGSFLHQLKTDREAGKLNGEAALFMPCADGPCRFGQYARLHDKILRDLGVEATLVSPNSDDNYGDIRGALRMHLLRALMVADVLTKLGCRLRPYEVLKRQTDGILENYILYLEEAFEKRKGMLSLLRQLNSELKGVELAGANKPLVGVVGEIYVRNSPFSNARLIENIEAGGGEAWVAPIMEWLHYTSGYEQNGSLWKQIAGKLSHRLVSHLESTYLGIFPGFLQNRKEPPVVEVMRQGKEFIPVQIDGESILTIGRAISFIRQGAALVVNVSPFGCMPGSISASILKDVSAAHGIPVVSLFFDGEADFSSLLATYIHNADAGIHKT